MWKLLFFVCLLVALTTAQKSRTSAHQEHRGQNYDIRLAVPGSPGNDYPTLGGIPRTSFSCAGKKPGYYADLETNCQVFRVCTLGSTYGFQSFICPNGTLFNQAVFVCDWWMNVNCPDSERLFKNNDDKFGNIRMGPQLMKDVKKMLSHPMRNPYDRRTMKSNLLVMQDYRLPSEQIVSNGAGPERPPYVYVPSKQVQLSGQNGFKSNDLAFAASTPNPRYIPAAFSTFRQGQQDVDVFQKQRQSGQYTQSNQLRIQQQHFGNGHTGQLVQNNQKVQHSRPNQSYNNRNSQYTQKQIPPTQNTINFQKGQFNGQNSQYRNSPTSYNGKQTFGKQVQYNSNQDYSYMYNQPQIQFSTDITGKAGNEAKQNLVSFPDDVSSTVVAKTLTLKRIIQDPKQGSPKSRITVKTWIVKPSKSAKLINPTPYTYDRPTQPPSQKLAETTPYSYVYEKPTTISEKLITQPDQPYVYNKPTTAARQVATSTTPKPTLSRLYLSPKPIPPTQPSRLYLAPTTYNPSSRIYLPPSANPILLSRQYLPPSNDIQPPDYEAEELVASPSTPTPFYASPSGKLINSPALSRLTKNNFNIGIKNLTFTDILTREKLDNTVNDIVQDTHTILKTAAPVQFEESNDLNSVDYSETEYLPSEPTSLSNSDSRETLTSVPPGLNSKSSRLISTPSTNLELPLENFSHNQNSNQISNLPFLKESLAPTNTIERTVSLKISIPEKIASFLFKNHSDEEFDKLEILNTGSSNYLVLTNKYVNKNTGTNFIPIGKLISDKQTNISNSQALVYSLLADSINVAKEYNRAHQGNLQTTPTQSQFQNINNDELAEITSQISQLTSSQFSNNQQNNYKSANLVATSQTPTSNGGYQYNAVTQNNVPQYQIPQSQNEQYNSPPHDFDHSYRYQNSNRPNTDINSKQVYSGQLYQLPVPDVTQQINKQSAYNNAPSNFNQQNKQRINSHISNGGEKSVKTDVEIVKSNLVQAPTTGTENFNSQENFQKFINSNSGISAQLQDKIIGTIPHPLEDNKVVTYKKDESFYVYTKLDNNLQQNFESKGNHKQSNNADEQQSAKLIQSNNAPQIVAFQLIPSVSYQLEDEKEQQKLLNAFQIDEFGHPKQKSTSNYNANDRVLTSNVDFTVDHSQPAKLVDGQFNGNNLYAGPSSYSAPQASVGRLVSKQDYNSRLELEEVNNGYSKVSPTPQFTFK